jgi:hypothetical protein
VLAQVEITGDHLGSFFHECFETTTPRKADQLHDLYMGRLSASTVPTKQQFMRASARHKSWHRVSDLHFAPLCRGSKVPTGRISDRYAVSIATTVAVSQGLGAYPKYLSEAVGDTLYYGCLTISCRPCFFLFASHLRCQCRATEKGKPFVKLESGLPLL